MVARLQIQGHRRQADRPTAADRIHSGPRRAKHHGKGAAYNRIDGCFQRAGTSHRQACRGLPVHHEQNLAKYRAIQEFAMEQGIDFYPAGRGIGHQV